MFNLLIFINLWCEHGISNIIITCLYFIFDYVAHPIQLVTRVPFPRSPWLVTCCISDKTIFHHYIWLCFFVFRKREQEQRRREAEQQEKWRVPLVRAEQETSSLVNIIEDLTMNDSVVKAKKSSKAERTKSKVERHKGTILKKFLQVLWWNLTVSIVLSVDRDCIHFSSLIWDCHTNLHPCSRNILYKTSCKSHICSFFVSNASPQEQILQKK